MRLTHPLVLSLALVAAACGQSAADTSSVPATETVPTTERAPEPMVLSYQFEPGTTLRYEVTFDQHLTMTATGDGSALGEEEMPGNADLAISGTTTFTHTVKEGAQPGTYDISIVGDFTDMEVTGTVDGEPVPSGEIPDLAEIDPVERTITVDEQGNVISGGQEDLDFFGVGDPAAAGGAALPGMDLGTLVGPPLAEGEVTVGDTWSGTIENPALGLGDESVTTKVESEVTGTETIDGVEVFIIESDSSTSAIEFDLAEMMIGFFTAFMAEEATPDERAELEAMMEELRFLMTIDPSSHHSTTWFDPQAGLARRSQSAGSTRMTFDINFPDEATGDMVAFAMDMTMDQEVGYRLLGTESA